MKFAMRFICWSPQLRGSGRCSSPAPMRLCIRARLRTDLLSTWRRGQRGPAEGGALAVSIRRKSVSVTQNDPATITRVPSIVASVRNRISPPTMPPHNGGPTILQPAVHASGANVALKRYLRRKLREPRSQGYEGIVKE